MEASDAEALELFTDGIAEGMTVGALAAWIDRHQSAVVIGDEDFIEPHSVQRLPTSRPSFSRVQEKNDEAYFYAEVRFSLDRGSAERSEGTRMSKKFGELLADGWELGSDNTFADLGLDAAEMKARTYLRAMIIARVENLRPTQSDVSRRTKLTQTKVSKLISDATAAGFSSDKLMKIATQLGLDVEIRVSDAQGENGKVTVAV